MTNQIPGESASVAGLACLRELYSRAWLYFLGAAS